MSGAIAVLASIVIIIAAICFLVWISRSSEPDDSQEFPSSNVFVGEFQIDIDVERNPWIREDLPPYMSLSAELVTEVRCQIVPARTQWITWHRQLYGLHSQKIQLAGVEFVMRASDPKSLARMEEFFKDPEIGMLFTSEQNVGRALNFGIYSYKSWFGKDLNHTADAKMSAIDPHVRDNQKAMDSYITAFRRIIESLTIHEGAR